MARRAAFWFFLVLLAVGFGWAANQQWRLSLPGLFNWQAEQHETLPDPGPDAGPNAESPDSVAATVAPPTVTEPASPSVSSAAESSSPAATPGTAPGEAETGGPAPAPHSGPSSQPPETAIATVEPTAPPASEPKPAPPSGRPSAAGATASAPSSAKVATESAGASEAAPEGVPGSAAPTAATSQAKTPGVAPAADPRPTDAAATSDAGAQDTGQQQATAGQEALPGGQATTTPTFDIVRVERDGRAVIAGRAEPGALVVVRSGEQVIDRVRASRRGDWVAVPTEPLRPGDQQLSVAAGRDDASAVRSEQVVVVAVPEAGGAQPAPGERAVAEQPPVAVLLPRDGKGPGRILQAPGRLSAEDALALMTVSYDESGKVLLSGEAPPGVPVRIYVDNRPAALVVGDAKGDWASSLDDTLAPGTYTLRLDQLDDKGQPVARIETPFTRVSDPPVEGQLQVDYVVVQPGNSLWRIARRLSGEGLDYLHIYDTNQSQIRDPDLIYPGQVFEIPVEVGSAG